MKRYVILAIWIFCGTINYGATVAYFQAEFPTIAQKYCREDIGSGAFFSLLGPLGTLPITFLSGFYEHGLQFTCEARP